MSAVSTSCQAMSAPVPDSHSRPRPAFAGSGDPAVSDAGPVADTVRAAQAGSEEAFSTLVRQFSARILNYLQRMTGNRHDAEDLTQETFLKAYRMLERCEHPTGFAAWLFTIARRTALNHFRSARHFEELSAQHQDVGHTPADDAETGDDRIALWDVARSVLKPRQYEALWLFYGEGLSIEETARVLGMRSIATKVLLHRARRLLAQRLCVRASRDPSLAALLPVQPEPRRTS